MELNQGVQPKIRPTGNQTFKAIIVIAIIGLSCVGGVAAYKIVVSDQIAKENQQLERDITDLKGNSESLGKQYNNSQANYTTLLANYSLLYDQYNKSLDNCSTISAEYNETTANYSLLYDQYNVSLDNCSTISAEYNETIVDYSLLYGQYNNSQLNYTTLLANYFLVYDQYNKSLNNYSSLSGKYNETLVNYSLLYDQYNNSQANYTTLLANYSLLYDRYNNSQANYTTLQVNHALLYDQYNKSLDNCSSISGKYNQTIANYSLLYDRYNNSQINYTTLLANYSLLYDQYNESLDNYSVLYTYYNDLSANYTVAVEMLNDYADFIYRKCPLTGHLEYANDFITPDDVKVDENTSLVLQSSRDGNLTWDDEDKIVSWVSANIEYNFDTPIIGGIQDYWQYPNETLNNADLPYCGYGDCEDHAILAVSMFKAEQNTAAWAWVAIINCSMGGHATVFINVAGDQLYIFDPTWGYNLSCNPSYDSEMTEIQQYESYYGFTDLNVAMIFNGNEYRTFNTMDEFYNWF